MNKAPRVIVAGVLAAAVQFALAVFGWGGWTPFFAHRALIALAVLTVAMIAATLFTSGNANSGIREDRGNRWVLAAFSLLALPISFVPAYTDRIGLWTIDGDATRWIGIVLYAVGGALRLWPVFVLGRRFSGLVAIQQGHTLETHGIYSKIRNPSYLGLLICTLGWALAFRSGIGIVLTALMIPPLIARMHSEERLLGETFGSEYEKYFARTWRLIPGIY